MKILFAPSEAKSLGGEQKEMRFCFDIEREPLLKAYDALVKNGSPSQLHALFGTKEPVAVDIFNSPVKKAVQRYRGVAYKYLDYDSLDRDAKEYIDGSLIIFSNLFGMLCANDLIPFYKLKQGAKIGDIDVAKYYKERLENIKFDEDILDLRAGYYEKFYKPKFCIKFKFLKDGKVVSHWAKAYRGKVARQLAKRGVKDFKELGKIDFEGLELVEVLQKKDYELWIFEVKE